MLLLLLFVSNFSIFNYLILLIFYVVPLDVSRAVRQFIEALFITHAETKLNTSGRLLHQNDGDDSISSQARVMDRGVWCRNLIRR